MRWTKERDTELAEAIIANPFSTMGYGTQGIYWHMLLGELTFSSLCTAKAIGTRASKELKIQLTDPPTEWPFRIHTLPSTPADQLDLSGAWGFRPRLPEQVTAAMAELDGDDYADWRLLALAGEQWLVAKLYDAPDQYRLVAAKVVHNA
jgi:hypothetical protein